jgi:hypothetical protein
MIDSRIMDGMGTGCAAHVHALPNNKSQHSGLVVLQERFVNLNPEVHFFLHETFGAAMNQAVAITDVPQVIHAGVDSGSAIAGTNTTAGANVLIDSGGGFTAAVGEGASVENTTDNAYARVTSVDSDTQCTLDADIFPTDTGDGYTINPIWTGNIVAGTWDFAATGKITITSANDNDEATFDTDSSRMWDMANFSTITGKVDLDTYDSTQNNMLLSFGLNGVLAGNSVNLDDHIDVGIFDEQSFSIPKANFGLSNQEVNDMSLLITRSGGVKPTIKFDDFHIQGTGGVVPAVFYSRTPLGSIFHVQEIRAQIADALTGAVTDGTMPGLGYSKILALSALTNGIVVNRVQDGVVKDSFVLRQLGDFLTAGGEIETAISDGTNTMITVNIKFPEPIVMNGNPNSYISITINDDLSGLLQFTASARGAIEI